MTRERVGLESVNGERARVTQKREKSKRGKY